MQVDPIKDGLNWLAYTGDNPVNAIKSKGKVSEYLLHDSANKSYNNCICNAHNKFSISNDDDIKQIDIGLFKDVLEGIVK